MTISIRGITLETARKKLDLWLDAEDAVAAGQSYTIGSRSLTRASLPEIAKRIEYWGALVSKLESGVKGVRIQRGWPLDDGAR